MKGIVSSKSPYGFKVDGNEPWFQYGNYYKGTKEFNVGDEIEYEFKGKYLQSLAVIKKPEVVVLPMTSTESATSQKTAVTSTAKMNGYQKSPEVQAQINRSSAVKSAVSLGSQAYAVAYQNGDTLELEERLAKIAASFEAYINTGEFPKVDKLSEVTSD